MSARGGAATVTVNNTNTVGSPIFVLRGADLQSTADQPFVQVGVFTNWMPTTVVGVRKTGGVTVACLGGIYLAAAKAGTPFVAATQTWAGVTGALGLQPATIITLLLGYAVTPIFSLSTGSTGAATADIFIFGYILD